MSGGGPVGEEMGLLLGQGVGGSDGGDGDFGLGIRKRSARKKSKG